MRVLKQIDSQSISGFWYVSEGKKEKNKSVLEAGLAVSHYD